MRSRAPLLIALATSGCMNEYHPEFHPVTTTTFVQNVSAPTTVVNESESESASHDVDFDDAPHIRSSRSTTPRTEIQSKKPLIVNVERSQELPQPSVHVDPPQAPGTYLGPNVEIGPGVTFGGNVYVQGDLVIGGTRQHPVLTTR
jgi:hypothetical protein